MVTEGYQLAYRAAGFATFPLNGKRAIVSEWQKLTPETCMPPVAGNYGITIKPGVLVVDYDPRRDPDAGKPNNEFVRFSEEIGGFPPTLIVFSGGGGLHYYYAIPAEMYVPKKLDRWKAFDFLSSKHYVVGPGSIHPDTGNPYAVQEGSPYDITPAPNALVVQFITSAKRNPLQGTPIDESEFKDDPIAIQAYTSFLQTCPPAVEGHGGDHSTFVVACHGRDNYIKLGTTFRLILEHFNPRCSPPWSDVELMRKVENAYRYGKYGGGYRHYKDFTQPLTSEEMAEFQDIQDANRKLDTTDGGKIKPTFQNLSTLLTLPGGPTWHNELYRLMRFNVLTQQTEYNYSPPWQQLDTTKVNNTVTDSELLELRYYLGQRYQMVINQNTAYEGTEYAARQTPYHPIQQMLNGMKWDGVDRLDSWMEVIFGVEPSDYHSLVGELLILSAVARAYQAGCKHDYLFILEGAQGARKSGLVKMLAILDRYAATVSMDTDKKDLFENVLGKWFIEVPEMAGKGFKKDGLDLLKKFLGDNELHYRRPYGKSSVTIPKSFVMIATHNPTGIGYLHDTTGNRRFLPVACRRANLEELRRILPQLYAEAVQAFRKGRYAEFPFAFLEEIAGAETELRMVEDSWMGAIAEWFAKQPDSALFSLNQIANEALGIPPVNLNNRMLGKLNGCVARLKLPCVRVSQHGISVRMFSKLNLCGPDDLRRRFDEALANFTEPELSFQDFLKHKIGWDWLNKNDTLLIGRWLKNAGIESERRFCNRLKAKINWLINKGETSEPTD